MDHIRQGKIFNYFKSPPAIKDDYSPFKAELKEIIERKLDDLNLRSAYLETEKERIMAINCPEDQAWFKLELAASIYEEHFVILKWQRYWLNLLDELIPKAISKKEKLDIAKAKEFPLEQLFQGELRQAGSRLVGCCPFHANGNERTPSFFIFPENRYYCFSCSLGGDAIDFVVTTKNYSFSEAVRSLT